MEMEGISRMMGDIIIESIFWERSILVLLWASIKIMVKLPNKGIVDN